MQLESALSSEDFAKYPFLKQASKQIEDLQFTISSLTSEKTIFDRAKNRVEKAISELNTGEMLRDNRAEISSFAAALILVIATKNSWIKKRYALAVAKTAHAQMLSPATSKEKVVAIARDFGWDITEGAPYKDFQVSFTVYLNNAAHFHGSEWKLVNQLLDHGMVYLNKDKAVRLLEEEVKNRVEKRLEVAELKNLPEEINIIASGFIQLAQDQIGEEMDDMPKVVVQAAFPPCINALYADAAQSRHLSHIGRFTLTSFMVNIGMTPEKVNDLFKSFSDYNERLTRYQIEHIAGERGSGTRYTCPQCSVLQTHGVCKNRDNLCRRIYHPLKYYKLKQASVNTG
ncbi:MAG: DNA primase large subunit PriL [Candidatus Bathyarchaeota archaeon]|nr:DNA primase large subunit PriL [Candidatus Bathyarchaeota archaeon]